MRDKRPGTSTSRLRFSQTAKLEAITGTRFGASPVARARDHNSRGSGIFPAPQRLAQVNGEFTFALTERIDKNRQTYLFAGIQMLGAVLFVRPDGPPGEGRRWRAVLKPYSGPGEIVREPSDEELDNAWHDQDKPPTGRQRR